MSGRDIDEKGQRTERKKREGEQVSSKGPETATLGGRLLAKHSQQSGGQDHAWGLRRRGKTRSRIGENQGSANWKVKLKAMESPT